MSLSGCDTMVALGTVTTDGETLFAKNSDRPADECQPLVLMPRRTHPAGATVRCQFVTLPQVAETHRHIGSQPYWCWGYEHGFNEHQVVIGNEALPSRLPQAEGGKLVGMELIRLGLERGRTAAEAVAVITDLVSRYGQGRFVNHAGIETYDNGYLVADPSEAYIIETAGHQWAVKRVARSRGISNVYSIGADWDQLAPSVEGDAKGSGWLQRQNGRIDFAATYANPSAWSSAGAARRARSCALLTAREGALDARTMMQVLRDHGQEDAPVDRFEWGIHFVQPTICMHDGIDGSFGNTAASLVAHLCADGARLPIYWCSFYSPCLALFIPILLEGELPTVLSHGGAQPDLRSPWWLFQRLTTLCLAAPEARRAQVRARWAPLQRQLLAEASRIAREGRRLLDAGQNDAAQRLTTDFMERSAGTMLAEAQGMVDALSSEKGRPASAVSPR